MVFLPLWLPKAREAAATASSILAPPKRQTPDQWADESRILPPGSAEPGRFRSSRTPWGVAIARACVNPKVRRIFGVMGSQLSKTETVLNVAGHKLDTDPAPILYIGPTRTNVSDVIEPRVHAMLSSAASLWRKTKKGHKAKALVKRVAGVTFRLAWAGSPTELASQPAHTVIVDEVDRMEPIKGEGDPITLAEARRASFADGRTIGVSSPTEGSVDTERDAHGREVWKFAEPEDVGSQIWQLWQEGTRHEWCVPCPHCGDFFAPRFRLLWWEKDATPQQALRKSGLRCPSCAAIVEESAKHSMNARGAFLAPGQHVIGFDRTAPGNPADPHLGIDGENGRVVGDLPDTDTFTFWVSGLCSPWVTFGQRAAAWLRAVRSGEQDRVRAELNTAFGELYTTRGQAPAWESIRDGCAFDYRDGDVPHGVQRAFLTIDVQKDRLVWVVRGFGAGFTSWRLAAGECWGETEKSGLGAWEAIDEVADRTFGGMPIRAVAIDSGYNTEAVYEWARKRGATVYATKGRDNPSKLYIATDAEVTRNGKRVRAGLKLWTIDDKFFKGWVHDHLGWPHDQPGAWFIPRWNETGEQAPLNIEDYCRQIVAEQRLRMPSGRVLWVGKGDNHFLDCEALQAFLAYVENVRGLKPLPPPGEAAKSKSWADRARALNG
jgi:phage terminase large subunit GpA-like protein